MADPINDLQPFGTQAGANVLSQADYLALPARLTGYAAGLAKSAQVNKSIRQASLPAYLMGQLIVDELNEDALDNGDLATLLDQFKRAINTAAAVIRGSLTLFVRTDGSDSNNGLTNTAAGAFLTIAAAFTAAKEALGTKGFFSTINVGPGTFVGGQFRNNGDPISIVGAGQGSTIISTPTGSAPSTDAALDLAYGNINLSGVTIQGSSANLGGLICRDGGYNVQNVAFVTGAATVANFRHLTSQGAVVYGGGAWTFTGSALSSLYAVYGGVIILAWNHLQAHTISYVGTPAFSAGTASASGNGYISNEGATISGAATGSRYIVQWNSLITAKGAGANFFPGSVAGTADSTTGGIYVV